LSGVRVPIDVIQSICPQVVVVDNHFAAIGGLDLCFGRWDTHNHPLADVHPTEFDRTLFPGQDYNNARIKDFKDVYNYASGTVSILESARMPWHDVHMTFVGPVVLDVVQHFVERWNEVKKRKVRKYPESLRICDLFNFVQYRNEA
jgi:phospholipase D1/2